MVLWSESYNDSVYSVTQWCSALCPHMDCNSPGSFVHGILQTRILSGLPLPSHSGYLGSIPRQRTKLSIQDYSLLSFWDQNCAGIHYGTPLVAQMVKNLPAVREIRVQSLGQKDLLEKEMATHSSILAWRTTWNRGAWRTTVHGVAKSQTWLSD